MSARAIHPLPVSGPARLRQGIQAVAADTAFRFGRHSHDQFGFGLIRRGAQTSASGRGTVEAGAGDLITVSPGEVHDGSPLDETGRAWQMLYLDPQTVTGLLAESDGPDRQREFHHPVIRDTRLIRPFLSTFGALTAAPDPDGSDLGALAVEERLIPLLTALLVPGSDRRGTPAGIAAARSRIDDDPAAPLTLETLAIEAGLSRFHLIRAFRRHTGLTPHAYVVQRRIQQARRMILRGAALADTAAACGFADQSHMTRQFVRMYGLPPGALAQLAD